MFIKAATITGLVLTSYTAFGNPQGFDCSIKQAGLGEKRIKVELTDELASHSFQGQKKVTLGQTTIQLTVSRQIHMDSDKIDSALEVSATTEDGITAQVSSANSDPISIQTTGLNLNVTCR